MYFGWDGTKIEIIIIVISIIIIEVINKVIRPVMETAHLTWKTKGKSWGESTGPTVVEGEYRKRSNREIFENSTNRPLTWIPGTNGQSEPKQSEETDIRRTVEKQDSKIYTNKEGLTEI